MYFRIDLIFLNVACNTEQTNPHVLDNPGKFWLILFILSVLMAFAKLLSVNNNNVIELSFVEFSNSVF